MSEAKTEYKPDFKAISPAERRLLDYIHDVGYGEIVVVVKGGIAVMVKRERKDIKLTD